MKNEFVTLLCILLITTSLAGCTGSDDPDGDGRIGDADAFPDNPDEWTDSDGDGYGDNKADAFPNDSNEYIDSDSDGVGDNADDCEDQLSHFPNLAPNNNANIYSGDSNGCANLPAEGSYKVSYGGDIFEDENEEWWVVIWNDKYWDSYFVDGDEYSIFSLARVDVEEEGCNFVDAYFNTYYLGDNADMLDDANLDNAVSYTTVSPFEGEGDKDKYGPHFGDYGLVNSNPLSETPSVKYLSKLVLKWTDGESNTIQEIDSLRFSYIDSDTDYGNICSDD